MFVSWLFESHSLLDRLCATNTLRSSQPLQYPELSFQRPSLEACGRQGFFVHMGNYTAEANSTPLDPSHAPGSCLDLVMSLQSDLSNPFEAQYQRLPAEICSIIMKMIFEEAFGPRKVHRYRNRELDLQVMNNFLALDRGMYEQYFELYWTNNIWVIKNGPVSKTMRFMTDVRATKLRLPEKLFKPNLEYSRQVPSRAALKIQSLELCFHSDDASDPADWTELIGSKQCGSIDWADSPSSEDNCTPRSQSFSNPEDFRAARENFYKEHPQHFTTVALRQWQDKFDRVAVLNLRHLVLDMREAKVPPDGEYLGVRAAELLIPFVAGTPADFKILAPTEEYEEQIRNIFRAKNS